MGDFNGDGKLDLAVANQNSNTVTILLGNADGTFTLTASSPTAGSDPDFVAVGDFNADGMLDLAVADYLGGLTILLGKGDGTFTATASSPPAGVAPYAIAIGDFNADGKLDLSVANAGISNVTILLGNGDGTFTPTASSFATGANPESIAVGDFNGDGRLDLATANSQSNNVSVIIQSSALQSAFVAPGSLTFGNQSVGTTSGAQLVTLSNSGSAALVISGISASANFGQTNNCGASVAASGLCTINVTFTPSTTGTLTGTLTITDNSGGVPGSVQIVPLTGTSASNYSAAGLTPTTQAFANQVINTTSSAKTITLSSTGTSNLSIASIAITGTNAGDFHQTNACPATLAPGAHCTISLTFTPAIPIAESAILDVTDNASNSPQTVALSGTGMVPAYLSPTGISYGNVGENSPSVRTIALYNNQAVALTISSITTGNPDFAQTNTCGASLASMGHCTISVTFTPTVLGAETATLTVNDPASNSPQTATLGGTGVVPAGLSATLLAFGNVGENSPSAARTGLLYNYEAVPLSISSITTSNPDFTLTHTCGTSVAANTYCTITVTFKPSVLGAETGTLTVNDAASNSPQTATLTGTGVVPATVSPTSLTFTTQTVGTTSSAKTVTLTSNLANAMPISGITFTGANPADFAQTNTCGSSLAAMGHCTISVTIKPTASGARTASLNVNDEASNSPQIVALTGTGN